MRGVGSGFNLERCSPFETETTIRIGVQSFSSIKASTFWQNWGLVALCYETVVERCLFSIQNSGGSKEGKCAVNDSLHYLISISFLDVLTAIRAWWISISTFAGWIFADTCTKGGPISFWKPTHLLISCDPATSFIWKANIFLESRFRATIRRFPQKKPSLLN